MIGTSFRVPFRTTCLLLLPKIYGVEMVQAVIVRTVGRGGGPPSPRPAKSGATPLIKKMQLNVNFRSKIPAESHKNRKGLGGSHGYTCL
jgi:hypothetical protein